MITKSITVQDHAIHLLEKLNGQRESDLFCDVVLKVEDKSFPAHRNVLSACSEYFRKMFKSSMKEQYNKDVKLSGLTPNALEEVLNFMYTEKITLSEANVADVLQAASLMLLTDLLEVVSSYLMESVDPSTCLYLREVSKLFSLETLRQKAEECVYENFEEVSSQESFCDLNESDVSLLLSSDELEVKSESVVFNALVRWVNKNQAERASFFPSLFKHIRLQHVSVEFLLNNLRKECLVKQFSECRDLVDDAFHFHHEPNLFEKQPGRRGRAIIFVMSLQGDFDELEICSGGVNVREVPKPTFPVYFTHVIAKDNGVMYMCGDVRGRTSQVISFDSRNFKIEGNLRSPPFDATAFIMQGNLYVVGGRHFPLLEVYQLQPTFTFIQQLPGQPISLSYSSSIVVGDEAYLIGGMQRRYGAQPFVKSFDFSTKRWTDRRSMNNARFWCGVAAIDAKIYVCGGYASSSSYLNTIEYMDTKQNVWTSISSHCPHNLGRTTASHFGFELFVCGEEADKLWKYDTETQKWTQDTHYENSRTGCRIISLP